MAMSTGTLDAGWALAWLRESARVIAENRNELIELDRTIGDGDHGENLDRGFVALLASLDALDGGPLGRDATPADVLGVAARTMISSVGGASGPLLGTAFLKASGAVAGLAELDGDALVAMLTAARDGIVLRGRAEPGEKTMVDAWTPAVDAARAALGRPEREILEAAADAAERGADETGPLIARKGRASYLGERAIGHCDPGARSSALILRAAATAAGA